MRPHFLCLVLGGRPSAETCRFSCLAWFLVNLGKFLKEISGSSSSFPDVWLLHDDSSPTERCLGCWFLTYLYLMALAASCMGMVGPSLFCLNLGPSIGLSDGDSSAVWKSLESVAASWMNCWNSPAGCRCSRTRVNLVGLLVLGGNVDLGVRLRGPDDAFFCLGSSSTDEMCPSSSVLSLRMESNCSWKSDCFRCFTRLTWNRMGLDCGVALSLRVDLSHDFRDCVDAFPLFDELQVRCPGGCIKVD